MFTKDDFKTKIKKPGEIRETVECLRSQGKVIVQCHGDFDLLHRGHLHQFEQAKARGDILIVSVTIDAYMAKGPGRPVFSQNIRAEMVAALGIVDFVVFNEASDVTELIKVVRPDVYVKGISCKNLEKDPSSNLSLEKRIVESFGGKIFYSHEMPIHATSLLNNFIDPYPETVLEYLRKIKERYSFDDIARLIDKLHPLKVLVVGEAIIDQYDYVESMDISPKGGVVAMRYLDSELFAGGSLACANHIANFCSDVTLFSYLGSKESYEEVVNKSLASNIKPWFLLRDGFGTIVKKRQISRGYFQKHSETYLFDDRPLNVSEEGILIRRLESCLDDFDLIFVIDYGHGFITNRVIKCLSTHSDKLAVNTQTNSANKGFNLITKYPRVNFPCLDHFEIKLAMHDKLSEPEVLAAKLKDQLGASVVAVTLGHHGSVLLGRGGLHRTPVFSKRVIDTVGAGDAFFSMTSLCITAGLPLDLVGFLGNMAGGLATTYIGNQKSVNRTMLFNFMSSLLG